MIYLDYAATSWPKPASCIHALEHFITSVGSNPKYSLHQQARVGEDLIDNARKNVAKILGVKNYSNVIFTLNATEALNKVLWGNVDRGHRVLASRLEHSSVTRPLSVIKKRRRIRIERIGDIETGIISPEHVYEACRKEPANLLVIAHASNVTGTIQPVEQIVQAAHENNCLVLVDASQTAGVLPMKTDKWDVDFLAFSGHKHLLGPMGVGGFYVADPDKLEPVIVGSAGYFDFSDEIPLDLPYRFEAGTPNAPGIAGLGASCEGLLEKGIQNIRKDQQFLIKKILEEFSRIPGVIVYGPSDPRMRVGVISFNIGDLHPCEVGEYLDQKFEIMVRTGLCSCHWANEICGTIPDGVVRASLGYFTKEDDVELLIEAVGMIATEMPRSICSQASQAT
ncbi:MAG: aminotransferase class V-fold PLP-dependent enzyme [bacterium]|nr:aminotransferase class V-fold PLP-dependent enzyme [bacterium]